MRGAKKSDTVIVNIKHTPRDDIDERMPTFAVRVVQLSVSRTERPALPLLPGSLL